MTSKLAPFLVAISVSICSMACKTFDLSESMLTDGVGGIFCEIGTPLAINLVPPSPQIPANQMPRLGFASTSSPIQTNVRFRVRLDACVTEDDMLTLQRVVIAQKDPGQAEAAFHEHWFGDDDIVQGLNAAMFDQDHEHLLIVDRQVGLSENETELFRMEGFRVGDKTYVAAGDTNGHVAGGPIILGTLEAGDALTEWSGVCDPNFQHVPFAKERQIGTATISARSDLTGSHHAYGLEVTITDHNPKLPEEHRGSITITGQAARAAYSSSSGHHGCWTTIKVVTPHATYQSKDSSLPRDNVEIQTIRYGSDQQETLTVPTESFPGPC